MKSKLYIFLSYFIVFIFIFFISKKYFIVTSMGLMMAAFMLSGTMASLSYSINKEGNNDAKFYLAMTFFFNIVLAFLGLFVELKEELRGVDFIAMSVFLIIVSTIASGGGYYYFNRVLNYKIEKNK